MRRFRSIPTDHLPIVVGRSYQRRDGIVVVAQPATTTAGFGTMYVCVAPEGWSIKGADHVDLRTGRVRATCAKHPHDLIRDVTGFPSVSAHIPHQRTALEREFEDWVARTRIVRSSLAQEDGEYLSRATRIAYRAYEAGRRSAENDMKEKQ